MVGSSVAPKWPLLAFFCEMDHQKSNFLLISDTLSVRGCWGQPMLIFWKMVVVPENSLSQHSRIIFKPNLTCILLFVRANSYVPVQCETPCIPWRCLIVVLNVFKPFNFRNLRHSETNAMMSKFFLPQHNWQMSCQKTWESMDFKSYRKSLTEQKKLSNWAQNWCKE